MQQEVAILSRRLQHEREARGETLQHLINFAAVVQRNASDPTTPQLR